MDDRRTFELACQVSHVLGYSFLRRSVEFVRQGRLLESLQTVASLAPVALGVVPYLAAFSTQHKDEAFLQAVAAHFPAAAHLRSATDRKAWITDTYAEVNGVSRTIQALAIAARKTGRPLTVLTCLEQVPPTHGRSPELHAGGHVPAAGIRVAAGGLPAVSGGHRDHRAAPLQRTDHLHARTDGADRRWRPPVCWG